MKRVNLMVLRVAISAPTNLEFRKQVHVITRVP